MPLKNRTNTKIDVSTITRIELSTRRTMNPVTGTSFLPRSAVRGPRQGTVRHLEGTARRGHKVVTIQASGHHAADRGGPMTRLVQVALRATDLDRAAAFYSELLGVEPSGRFEPPGLLFFDLDGVRLLLDGN